MRTPEKFAAVCLVAAMTACGSAAEYFVGKEGNDANNGLSREAAFLTVQRGVNALEPGDTLTISPGEYFENVSREDLGSMESETVIRAEIPGTVLLRGDVPAPAFRKVERYRFVYAADFDQAPQALNEVDTLQTLESVPNVADLEFNPGAFHYDEHTQTMYMSASDLRPADRHHYTVSVLDGRAGMFLARPRRVVIEGLSAAGFHRAVALSRLRGGNSSSDRIPHGFYLWRAKDCVVRDTRAYLNAGGISILSDGGNLIEGCEAYANQSKHGGSAGNIVVFSIEDDTVRDSLAYKGGRHGIRMYGGGENPEGRVLRNLSWGNRGADFQIKAGALAAEQSWVDRCVAPLGAITASDVRNCVIGQRLDPIEGSIVLGLEEDLDPNQEFADPVNFDYRLQSTSRFRGAGEGGADVGAFPYEENVFYVKPDGDDGADGLSLSTAWATLPRALGNLGSGDTLYLEAGRYAAGEGLSLGEEGGKAVSIRGHGEGTVTVEGVLLLAGGPMSFERITFADGVSLQGGQDASFDNCRFAGGDAALSADGVEGLRVTHCEFTGQSGAALDLPGSSGVFLSGNIFDNESGAAVRADSEDAVLYSDYNSYRDGGRAWQTNGASVNVAALQENGRERYSTTQAPEFVEANPSLTLANREAFAGRGPLGKALGVHVERAEKESVLRLAGPFVHSVTDATANIEWWVSGPTDFLLAWGEGDRRDEEALVEAHRFGTFSLKGLKPDTEYSLSMTLDLDIETVNGGDAERLAENTVAITFRTAAAAKPTKTLYVAPDGEDANDGLSRGDAWRTVNHAANQTRAGDTVLIAGGTYRETVRVRATGEWGRPVAFKAMPGEKVVFDGNGRTLDCAFYVTDKHYVHLDGFYFVDFMSGSPAMPWSDRRGGSNGSVVAYRSDHLRVARCFHDSRGPGYGPGLIQAQHCADLLLQNNVITGSMGGGVSFGGCPDMRIVNNVFLRNLIQNVSEAINEPDQKFLMANNIFTDSIASKVGGSLFAIGKIESLIERDNCYYLRVPNEEREMFMFYEPEPAYGRAARGYRMRYEFDEPPVIKVRTRATLAEYQKEFNPGSGSVVADPMFKVSLGMEREDEDGNPIYLGDRVSSVARDFNDLFTANPDLIERGIGLQPEAFAEFHFNVAD